MGQALFLSVAAAACARDGVITPPLVSPGGAGRKKKRKNIYPAFDGPGDWESSYVTGVVTPLETE